MRKHIIALLAAGLLACLVAPALADSEGATVTTRQAAVIRFTTGQSYAGTLHSLNAKEVRFFRRGQKHPDAIRYPAHAVRSVETAMDLYTYDAKAGCFTSLRDQEAARSGKVKVVNTTDREFTFIVTGARNKLGVLHRIPLVEDDDRPQSNLELGLRNLTAMLGGRATPAPGWVPPRWPIKARESRYLDMCDGETLTTSRLEYTVKTLDGKRGDTRQFDAKTTDFEITLGAKDLPPPVLVNVGLWEVDQLISNVLVRVQVPGRIFPNGQYTWPETRDEWQEVRGSKATAKTQVKNTTNKTIDVYMTVEFRFTHLVMSTERVKLSCFTLKPEEEKSVTAEVATRAIINNRKAVLARHVELTTLPRE